MDRTHSFGYWLRRRRKALDLTQAELAERASCSLELIQKIETDARRPSRQMAEKLADVLGIGVSERAAFIQAARAERAADSLVLPSQPAEQPLASLPQGTITFLLTDIEGSTRLWEQHPRSMPAALARHDALLKEIIAAHGGVVFKTVGDSVLAAFAQAPDALAAALAAQRTVRAELWALPEPPRVRMALHTGHAEVRAGDYLGPTLNRAARLLAAGHGDQVLLSLTTEQLVREHLTPDSTLRDLGTHRLKDLSLPEQIFQLVTSDLPATFPALNTLDARHTNLPIQPTTLIGRERELAQIVALLGRADVRLITLTGPGGTGKTRLAMQVASELVDDFPDGVYFVDLAPIREPALVIGQIATTLGVKQVGSQPLLATLKEYLRDKQVLLLLDNFEQVIDAAPLVAQLSATASKLKLLVTSREVLHLRGEKEVAVPPLALPDPAHLPLLEQLSQYAAVALLIERTRDTRPDFMVTNANAPALAEICARLDGLPLAIELAAARLKLFTPETLLARLSSRLPVLTGGARDLPMRQQTMRTTIAWSYDLLNEAEQTLFRRLGVFVGGCTLEAIGAVCTLADESPLDVMAGAAALLDKSLLRQVAAPEGDTRFGLLETIREYALERLEASGEAKKLRRQHALYYMAFGEEQWLRETADYETLISPLLREFDNLLSALAWSQTTVGDSEMALRITNVIDDLWGYRGAPLEAIAAFERSLNHPLGVGRTKIHAYVRTNLAGTLFIAGHYAAAQHHLAQALQLARELGMTALSAQILHWSGLVAREQGDAATAWSYLSESLALWRTLGDTDTIVMTLNSLAGCAILEEDPARAEVLLAESRAVAQSISLNNMHIGWTLNHLGLAAQLRGEHDRAMCLHEESLAYFPTSYHAGWQRAYHSIGETALSVGQLAEAAGWLRRSLEGSWKVSDQEVVAWCLAGLGSAAALDEEPERAARLWGAAEALRQKIGCRPAPAARATYERAIALARSQLGEDAFAAAWAAGQALTLEQVIEGCA